MPRLLTLLQFRSKHGKPILGWWHGDVEHLIDYELVCLIWRR